VVVVEDHLIQYQEALVVLVVEEDMVLEVAVGLDQDFLDQTSKDILVALVKIQAELGVAEVLVPPVLMVFLVQVQV
jgi:hypothetical protein